MQTPIKAPQKPWMAWLEVVAILGALSGSWLLYLEHRHIAIYGLVGVCSLILLGLTAQRLRWLFKHSQSKRIDSPESTHDRPHQRKLDKNA